jgi:hypothetical protein
VGLTLFVGLTLCGPGNAGSPGSGGASPYPRRGFLLGLGLRCHTPLLHYSTTPLLHYSNTPLLRTANTFSSLPLDPPKKELPVTRELPTDTDTDTYFLGSHLSQFAANSSTLSFVTGISSPLTKVEAGFLLSATMSYSMSTDLVPHS